MATLKTNYKDDLFSGSRKYEMIRNQDGTVSFEDVTDYLQEGDPFGSTDINVTNTEVNAINQNLTELDEDKVDKFTPISGSGKDALKTALDGLSEYDLLRCKIKVNSFVEHLFYANSPSFYFNHFETGNASYGTENRLSYVKNSSIAYKEYRTNTTTGTDITVNDWIIYQ